MKKMQNKKQSQKQMMMEKKEMAMKGSDKMDMACNMAKSKFTRKSSRKK
jgi:hypothetical protein